MPKTPIALSLVIACGVWSTTASAQPPKADRPGRAEFIEMGCYQCHGYEGQGGRGTGPKLAPKPLDWEVFSVVVRQPPKVMPAYSPRVLSDEKLKTIYAYLKSIPPAPDVKTVPALSGQ